MLKRVLGSIAALSFASLAALLVGCPAPPQQAGAQSATAPTASSKLPPLTATKACKSKSDCNPGQTCAFAPGCGPGTCEPERPCTMDLVAFCGCDGQVFQASGSCPNQPFSKKGGCGTAGNDSGPPGPPVPGAKKACQSNADCAQGEMCQGTEGCGAPWTCGPVTACTKDLVEYCACDGTTFKGSGTCPGKPVRRRGKC